MLCGLTNLEVSLIIIFLAKCMHSFQQLNVFIQQLERTKPVSASSFLLPLIHAAELSSPKHTFFS